MRERARSLAGVAEATLRRERTPRRCFVPSPNLSHAHPLTIGYGYLADAVALGGALLVIGAATWWWRRSERSLLRKYPPKAQRR